MPSILNPHLCVDAAGGPICVTFLGIRLDPADIAAVGEYLPDTDGRLLLRLDLAHVEYLNGAALAELVARRVVKPWED